MNRLFMFFWLFILFISLQIGNSLPIDAATGNSTSRKPSFNDLTKEQRQQTKDLFLEASVTNNVPLVTRLLPLVRDTFVLVSSFIQAAERGHKQVVLKLLPLMDQTVKGFALVRATASNQLETMRLLVNGGTNVHFLHDSPLFAAKTVDSLTELLNLGAMPFLFSDASDHPPPMYAKDSDMAGVASSYCEANMDRFSFLLNAANNNLDGLKAMNSSVDAFTKDLALTIAVRGAKVEAVAFLVANGANVSSRDYLALREAIYIKQNDIIKLLLESGEAPTTRDPVAHLSKFPELMWTHFKGQMEIFLASKLRTKVIHGLFSQLSFFSASESTSIDRGTIDDLEFALDVSVGLESSVLGTFAFENALKAPRSLLRTQVLKSIVTAISQDRIAMRAIAGSFSKGHQDTRAASLVIEFFQDQNEELVDFFEDILPGSIEAAAALASIRGDADTLALILSKVLSEKDTFGVSVHVMMTCIHQAALYGKDRILALLLEPKYIEPLLTEVDAHRVFLPALNSTSFLGHFASFKVLLLNPRCFEALEDAPASFRKGLLAGKDKQTQAIIEVSSMASVKARGTVRAVQKEQGSLEIVPFFSQMEQKIKTD